MDDILINTNVKPSGVDNFGWIYCVDEDIHEQEQSKFDPDLNGKWMMFFKKGVEMDGKWKQACDLYRQGKLDGITSMKVSTLMHDPVRTSNTANGVICFYCGPSNDQSALMIYGKNLLRNIAYDCTFMRYKSDEQTMGGTVATGQKINSMYKIQVSDINLAASHNSSSNVKNSTTKLYDGNGPNTSSNQNWRERKHSESTNWRERNRHDETNWRQRNRPEETSWRSRNRNHEPSNSNGQETNWRQPIQDRIHHSVAPTSVSSQNNVESNDNTPPYSKRSSHN